MNRILSVLCCCLITSFCLGQVSFYSQQLRYSRFESIHREMSASLESSLKNHGIESEEVQILLTAFKEEGKLECYVKNKSDKSYTLFETYSICSKSGILGPKLQQGDEQVPEGFYYINVFNPTSAFHLSLGINYPNTADRNRSDASNLGGDIFIHGDCVTIGCLPMEDKIKEIYWLAVKARDNGQSKIPVYIFPFEMSEANLNSHLQKKEFRQWSNFWHSLKIGYDSFYKSKKAFSFKSNELGDYLLFNE